VSAGGNCKTCERWSCFARHKKVNVRGGKRVNRQDFSNKGAAQPGRRPLWRRAKGSEGRIILDHDRRGKQEKNRYGKDVRHRGRQRVGNEGVGLQVIKKKHSEKKRGRIFRSKTSRMKVSEYRNNRKIRANQKKIA